MHPLMAAKFGKRLMTLADDHVAQGDGLVSPARPRRNPRLMRAERYFERMIDAPGAAAQQNNDQTQQRAHDGAGQGPQQAPREH